MTAIALEHMHQDLEDLKKDIAVIKHILSEEGKLTEHALKSVADARAAPDSEYISHKDLTKRLAK